MNFKDCKIVRDDKGFIHSIVYPDGIKLCKDKTYTLKQDFWIDFVSKNDKLLTDFFDLVAPEFTILGFRDRNTYTGKFEVSMIYKQYVTLVEVDYLVEVNDEQTETPI